MTTSEAAGRYVSGGRRKRRWDSLLAHATLLNLVLTHPPVHTPDAQGEEKGGRRHKRKVRG